MTQKSDSSCKFQSIFAPRGGGLEKTRFGVKEFSAKVDMRYEELINDYKIYQVLSFDFEEL
jgi:hypothetical protein